MSKQAEQTDSPETDATEDIQEEQQPANTAEDAARAGGWKPLKEWEGDPAEWRSAEVFNERGEWIQRHKAQQKQIDEIQSSFNTRMDNANKLHKVALESQRTELVRKRDDAIDNADREGANSFQDQIDKINAQPVETAPVNGQSALDAWNQSNQWILQNTPKAGYAKQQFGLYQSQGMTPEQAISVMETDVSREFPAINPGRENHPVPEGGSLPGKKRASRKLGMSDLTSDELMYYRAMPGAWKTDAEYLQAVQDTRSEQ